MKKNYSLILVLFSTFLLLTACGNDNDGKSEKNNDSEDAIVDEGNTQAEEVEQEKDQIAICLWGQGGIRSAPGRESDAKWVSGVSFGDIAILTGNSKLVKEKDRERNYLEMTLSDGKSGWSYDYLFAVGAERGVVKKDIDIYKKPELTSFDTEKFNRGEVIAYIKGEKEGWFEAFGKEKKKMGWIRSIDDISNDEVDVTVGILADKAMDEKSPVIREEMLQSIASNSTFNQSELIDIIENQLTEATEKAQLKDNQLYITGDNLNARSAPDTKADNVVFKLKSGDVCEILEIGQMVEINDMKDYWYKISFEGKEGWIFGAFTSKQQ